jgi:glycosyltransferase involved in cell wall biosynthesis
VRILLDYRAALRERTGVGETAHQLAAALLSVLPPDDTLTLFSSSWKDRLSRDVLPAAGRIDARIPVRVLNYAWHRLEWPPVEWLAGPVDIAHSMHPAMVPSRAVRFVTIFDLYFLDHRSQTTAEVRRDYASLVSSQARRADGVVVPSDYTRKQVQQRLGVLADRIVVCPPGAPEWPVRREPSGLGPILFVGTIEPRKNVGTLLKAYGDLARHAGTPPLVLAGRVAEGSESLLAPINGAALADRVQVRGYVSDEERQRLYREASMLVLPSFDEGFGLPALEAMTVGTPVIVARRGSLPEVVGDAGLFVDPGDAASLTNAMATVLGDELMRQRMADAGLRRARTFNWPESARRLLAAYAGALRRRQGQ